MIELCDCSDDFHPLIHVILEDHLTKEGIVNSLKNLRALAFLSSVETSIDGDCSNLVGSKLLNYICNQLTSLHIGDYSALFWYGKEENRWNFLRYAEWTFYFYTEMHGREMTEKEKSEMYKESWFPLNVKELCLFDAMDKWDNHCTSVNTSEKQAQHIWHESVNSQLFPNLLRLKIINDLDYKNRKLFIESSWVIIYQFISKNFT